MEITNEIVTYLDVLNGVELVEDLYGIGSFSLRPCIKNTFLSNPFLRDKSQCMIYLTKVDGIIGGRIMLFPTQVIANGKCIEAQSASSLAVVERFRSLAIGSDLILDTYFNSSQKIFIYAGISKMALPIYKKMKFHDLESPIYWQPRNSKFIIERIGIKGTPLYIFSAVCNVFLKGGLSCLGFLFKRNNSLETKEMLSIPEWVSKMVIDDEHLFKEHHNGSWFEWVLNNNFSGSKEDIQKFYAIYSKDKEVGFFLIKERALSLPDKNISKIVIGSIIEWGVYKDSQLSEYDVYRLAIEKFSQNVSIVEFTSLNKNTVKRMKRLGFFHHGSFHIIVKSKNTEVSNLSNINDWRIRLGYADVPFY